MTNPSVTELDHEKPKMLLPTGQVLGVLGIKYRTLYNYLRDFEDYFSKTASKPKKGKRWTADDLSVIQAIRHLHSERRGIEYIKEQLSEGWRPPLEGLYKPEDINRLVESAFLFQEQAAKRLERMEELFNICQTCEFETRRHVSYFRSMIYRWEDIEHDLKQVKLIVGRISDSHKARQERDREYERLHAWIRFRFLDEEDDRQELQRLGNKDALESLEIRASVMRWVKRKLKIK